jgi:cytoskeletal protein CcmA (bactofilin family)
MIWKSDSGDGELNGFLDRGSRLEGDLKFENSFRVDGHLAGTVSSDGKLIVGDDGEVDGDIVVRQVLVSGTLRGRVRASGRIHLMPSARVHADLETVSLVIDEGAMFEGRCTMGPIEAAPGEGSAGRNVRQMPPAAAGGDSSRG